MVYAAICLIEYEGTVLALPEMGRIAEDGPHLRLPGCVFRHYEALLPCAERAVEILTGTRHPELKTRGIFFEKDENEIATGNNNFLYLVHTDKARRDGYADKEWVEEEELVDRLGGDDQRLMRLLEKEGLLPWQTEKPLFKVMLPHDLDGWWRRRVR